MKIILASASPRRKELLEQVGINFSIIPACGDEKTTKTKPEEVVMELAEQKAAEIANQVGAEETLVIGADTIVAIQGRILGKPRDEQHAREMLQMLQGKTHQVFTGTSCIICRGSQRETNTFVERTDVTMFPMTEQEILDYIATGDPMDKAGAYGIQGICARYVERIQGDYNNVVGLPVGCLWQGVKKWLEKF